MYNYHRIKDLKEDNDLKQSDVAKIINMSEKQYARYERGETDIPLQLAIKLCDYYNVSLDYLSGRSKDKKGLCRSELSDTETNLIKLFRDLSEQQQGIILGRIEAMTEENEETAAKMKGAI